MLYSSHITCYCELMLRPNLAYPSVVNYTRTDEPIVTSPAYQWCPNYPLPSIPVGTAVDYQTDNIYVADQHTVREANFLFNFRAKSRICNLYYSPASISIHNMLVYVKIRRIRLFVFDLSGNFITEIKIRTSAIDGFAIDQTYGDIYACDNFSGEINVLQSEYPYDYVFANGIVGDQLDIKLTEEFIYVLSDMNPYIYLFKYSGTQIETRIQESFLKQFLLPFGSAIDRSGNILLCHSNMSDNNNIVIIDSEGKILHKIGYFISKPLAITINSAGRIIIVDPTRRIQIY